MFPDLAFSAIVQDTVDVGEALLAALLVAMLIIRMRRSDSLERASITPVVVAGIAASASAIAQEFTGFAGSPNEAYLIEGIVDLALPLSFLISSNALLRAEVAESELARVRESRALVIRAGFDDRKRILANLHDGAQARLASASIAVALAMMKVKDKGALDALQIAAGQLDRASAELRDLARGIYPVALRQHGLAKAIQDGTAGIAVPIDIDIPDQRYDQTIEDAAYFIALAALTDVEQHARAGSAAIVVRVYDREFRLEVTDDGIGGADVSGHGFANMRARAMSLDGALTVDSPPGEGTRVTVVFPCA